MPVTKTNREVWHDSNGKELLRLTQDGKAYIVPCFADAEMLKDLAEACAEASTALSLIAETQAGAAT